MFWRLLLILLAFAVVSAGGVTLLMLYHEPEGITFDRFIQASPAILVVGLISLPMASYFAWRFVRPFQILTNGARRIAEGNYGFRIHGGVLSESRALAIGFNRMSKRLAEQFAQLEADRQQLRTILSGMVEGVIAVDTGQRVLFANESAGRMLYFDPTRIVGRLFPEITRLPPLQVMLNRVIASGKAARQEINTNGQSPRILTVYIASLPGPEDPGAVLVLQDTTELRRLERLRQEFSANVSHELKTPLAIIQSQVEALLDGAVDDPEVRQPFLEQIADQSNRLYALILDLLRLASIESQDEVLEIEPLSLERAVRNCIDRHQIRAEMKNIRLEAAPPPSNAVKALADDEALCHILDNLVDNAVKYTQEGGVIRVKWFRQDEGTVGFQVEDNGPGIPERDLPRIFERFYRVDKARSREMGGTGLGLSIVKHLAQAMKGSVKATSEIGRGTTFTVTLPRA